MGNITAELSADKKLKVTSEAIVLSGENLTSELIITIPSALSEYDLFLEFFCSDGYVVTTNQLTLDDLEIVFPLPYEILRRAGRVDFQLIAREEEDIVYKSRVASFEVDESINATEILEEEFTDVIRSAEQAIEATNTARDSAISAKDFAISAASSAEISAASANTAAYTANAATSAANTAAQNCESKAQAAEDIIEDIESAIDNADTAAASANAAATLASSASTSANLAAVSADSARESALSATENANTAASAASTSAASAAEATSDAISSASAANAAASNATLAADAAANATDNALNAAANALSAASSASSAASDAISAALTATSATDTATAAANAANSASASASLATTAANAAATSANEAATAANTEITLMQELYQDVEDALENFTTAYEAAVQGGYEGTEEEFNSALLKMPDCITEEEASLLYATMGLQTSEDQIILRKDATTALGDETISGIKVSCADGINDGIIGLDNQGRIVAGLNGNTKYYTERYNLMADEAFLIWDNENKYAFTNNNFKMSHFVRLRTTEVITLLTTGWVAAGEIYTYTLTHGYVTEDALVFVNYDDASKAAAVSAGVHNYDPVISLSTVVIKASSVPTSDLNVKLVVLGGIAWE